MQKLAEKMNKISTRDPNFKEELDSIIENLHMTQTGVKGSGNDMMRLWACPRDVFDAAQIELERRRPKLINFELGARPKNKENFTVDEVKSLVEKIEYVADDKGIPKEIVFLNALEQKDKKTADALFQLFPKQIQDVLLEEFKKGLYNANFQKVANFIGDYPTLSNTKLSDQRDILEIVGKNYPKDMAPNPEMFYAKTKIINIIVQTRALLDHLRIEESNNNPSQN